ncbi:MAG: anaerobic ribonucleoside-triphosphate reductase activating protein [Deltaproteobacteria bacterium]|nr:anaerobic ribonucleoside-triphosphate reductase activating protein [Deltaproteobacteria bacterium]MBN2673829.1 anaerobic ribonucleoside-triphosphate reductase activating protein [Deltaproteobacteria bacterium]
MKWGGFTPMTLSDFPGKIAAIAFTRGCNFNCVYCHNRTLLHDSGHASSGCHWTSEKILAHLERRKKQLEGLVVSGGEPTIQPGLFHFLQQAKALGYLIKLDTNGSNPHVLQKLIEHHLLDYVAMDIKAPYHKYNIVANTTVPSQCIQQSVRLLNSDAVPAEFRVTAISPLHAKTDFEQICRLVNPCIPLYLQSYQPVATQEACGLKPFSGLADIAFNLQKQYENIFVR